MLKNFTVVFFHVTLLRNAIEPLDAGNFRLQHLSPQSGDLIELSFFFFADKTDQSVLFHFGKTSVHRAGRELYRAVCQPLHRLHNAVPVVR